VQTETFVIFLGTKIKFFSAVLIFGSRSVVVNLFYIGTHFSICSITCTPLPCTKIKFCKCAKLQRFLRCKSCCFGRFWISLITIPEHQNPSEKAISAFVRMPTTHIGEGFLLLSK